MIYKEFVMHSAAVAVGNGNTVYPNDIDGGALSQALIQITGLTANANVITFEGTVDDSNWVAVPATNISTGGMLTTATADGIYLLPCQGLNGIRARISTYNGGTVAAKATLTQGGNSLLALRDSGYAYTTSLGITGAAVVSADLTTAAAITDAPATGQKLVLVDLIIATDTAMYVEIEEETSGTVLMGLHLAAGSSYQFTPRGKVKTATAGKKIFADSDTAGNISISAIYYSEP